MADTMLVTLDEAKLYLRIDHDDEDELIEDMIRSSEALAMDVARLSGEEISKDSHRIRPAVLYALAYFYEHREEADHHELTLMLRSLLFGVRKQVF